MPQICLCPTINCMYKCFGHYIVDTSLGTKIAYTTHIVTASTHSGTCTYTFYEARLEVLTSCRVGVGSTLNSTSLLFPFGTQDDPLVSPHFFERSRVENPQVDQRCVQKIKEKQTIRKPNKQKKNGATTCGLCVLGKNTNLAGVQ